MKMENKEKNNLSDNKDLYKSLVTATKMMQF